MPKEIAAESKYEQFGDEIDYLMSDKKALSRMVKEHK